MAHSIELLLDQRADASIRQVWRGLAEAGLPSRQRSTSDANRPHVTLVAAERISSEVDGVLAGLAEKFPLRAIVGAPVAFGGGGRLTLARLVVPSEDLLALHDEIYGRCRPFASGMFAHGAPGQWTPHVTLGRRFSPAQVGEALAVVDGIATDITANVVGLRRWDGDAKRETSVIPLMI